MQLLSSSEKKKILNKLNKQFGIEELPYLIIKFGEKKLRIYSGELGKEELKKLDKETRIESAGLYFAKLQGEEIRLTLDGTQILKKLIKKSIVNLNIKETKKWFKGEDLDFKERKGFVILKNKEDFIGCGKSTGEKIINYLPKERRIRGHK